jgi:hypothetical protein
VHPHKENTVQMSMSPKLPPLLLKCDGDLAAQTRAEGCLLCGAALHSASYPRKPRGGAASSDNERRFSFCCAREGCRRRATPPSVRFLGRKVYLGAVVVLASAMLNGLTPARLRRLHELLGASERTLCRWGEWWRTAFAESPFWRAMAGFFHAPVAKRHLPASLLERFAGGEEERLIATLRFLAPVTTSSSRNAMAF